MVLSHKTLTKLTFPWCDAREVLAEKAVLRRPWTSHANEIAYVILVFFCRAHLRNCAA